MLLFSTVLNIKNTVTKEQFIELVAEWNSSNPREVNRIPDVKWNGEKEIRFGSISLWMEIRDWPDRSITAVRYEKTEADGIVWDTDYILNLEERKLAVQLDRSYKEEALRFSPEFATPHFITLLIQNGFLEDDGNIPVLRTPVYINGTNAGMLADVISGSSECQLPVVFVSKLTDGRDPLDAAWLASRLKGAAHILVQENISDGYAIRTACEGRNEYHGAVGIHFPNRSKGRKRILYKDMGDGGKFMLEKTISCVIRYMNSLQTETMYTWQGTANAMLNDSLARQVKKRKDAEAAKQKAENETEEIYGIFGEDINKLSRQIEELARTNEALKLENQGLRSRLNRMDDVPVLVMGDEQDLYPGEVKELVLSALEKYLEGIKGKTRRRDVISGLIENNGYQHITKKRSETVRNTLKDYTSLTGPVRKALTDLGFKISEDGKHYKLVYYGDGRYWLSLAKTPSDSRGGKNVVSEIINKML